LQFGENDKAAPRYAVMAIADSSARHRPAVAIIAAFVRTLADCAAVTAFAASKQTRRLSRVDWNLKRQYPKRQNRRFLPEIR
jgi:hypothetical protein